MQSKFIWLVVLGLLLAASCFAAENGRGDVFGSVGIYHSQGKSQLMAGGGGSLLFASGKLAAFGELEQFGERLGRFAGGGLRVYIPLTGHFWCHGTLNRVKPFVPVAGGYANLLAQLSAGEYYGASWYGATGAGVEIGSKRFGVRPEFRYMRVQYAGVGREPGRGTNNTTIGISFYFGF